MPAQVEKFALQYFTGTQATIWVGDIFIDECNGIQFHATQSIIPIYGYASTYFDAVARGKVLVQGAFEINFVDEGYLFAVFKEADDRRKTTLDDTLNRNPLNGRVVKRDIPTQIKEQIEILKEVQEFRAAETDIEVPNIRKLSRQQALGDVLTSLANLDIAGAEQLGRELADRSDFAPTENVIYKMIPFRLTGHFGHPELYGKEQGTFKELDNCFLVSNELIVGANDEPVRERYSFIARQHI